MNFEALEIWRAAAHDIAQAAEIPLPTWACSPDPEGGPIVMQTDDPAFTAELKAELQIRVDQSLGSGIIEIR